MKLSLARLENHWGSSRGHWFVRELPGFKLVRGSAGWQVDCFPACSVFRADRLMEDASLVWGKGWTPSSELLLSLPEAALLPHPSRASALFALESALSARPASQAFHLLSEL